MDPGLAHILHFCEKYKVESGGLDLTIRGDPKLVGFIIRIVAESGPEGHKVISEVKQVLSERPIIYAVQSLCENPPDIPHPLLASILGIFLQFSTRYKPPGSIKVEGLDDDDIMQAWWEQTHPRNIKRGRSDPGPQNKRVWKGDPDEPIRIDR